MLCQKCSLKKECRQTCIKVESYLDKNRNYKITYKNKEVGLVEYKLEQQSLSDYTDWRRSKNILIESSILENPDNDNMRKIKEAASRCLTPKQEKIYRMYVSGISISEIGRRLGITGQAVSYAVNGHPKHGGGFIRKIQKELGLYKTSRR